MGIISEDKVRKYILPYLSIGKRGFKPKSDQVKLILLILKRMKTRCQWRELSIKEYFTQGEVCWQTVYYHFNKWSKDGSFKEAWIQLLKHHKKQLDMSSVQLDGSHPPCKRGGLAVGYQGRKACKTSNSLFLCDNTGQMLSVGIPQSGDHNDLYNIETIFTDMLAILQEANIDYSGIFLNADPGFDSEGLKQLCIDNEIMLNVKPNPKYKKGLNNEHYFDELLYKQRTKIEHANAWIDAFKSLIIRYEKLIETWISLQFLAFITMFCRKLKV